MSFSYIVPTIPQNLNKTESVLQIVEVLDHVTTITEDILGRVNDRIRANNERLSNISSRIDVAASKVNQLKGAKKATRVFSSSKYPAAQTKTDYESIFRNPPNLELVRSNFEHKNYVSVYEPLTKLQFFHVKVPEATETRPLEGLGNVPSDIKCLNDVLLFNTGKNLYKEFTYTDSLKGPEVTREREALTASELGAAPLSISERSSLHRESKESYFYTPQVEELPALDVPLDLPDLPGVANDLKYELDVESTIAPSAVQKLPEMVLDVADSVEILPPPPPPPVSVPTPPPVQELPPPPPLLPSPPRPLQQDTVTVEAVPPSDSRASLMEAIRTAGGSQKAKLRRTNPAAEGKGEKEAASGDLMADLHSKLMMRRKGISGATKKQEDVVVTADSALARISSLIPPPPPKIDVDSGGSSDDDDWNE